ncbi:hypothetical protein MRX96_025720 [Rhipicephalus microplus]
MRVPPGLKRRRNGSTLLAGLKGKVATTSVYDVDVSSEKRSSCCPVPVFTATAWVNGHRLIPWVTSLWCSALRGWTCFLFRQG